MKTEFLKNAGHEAGYIIFVTVALIVLSFFVFPLLIAFLPVAIIAGCTYVWRLDHIRVGKRKEK